MSFDLPESKEIIPPENGWRAEAYYVVDIAVRSTNIIHRSIFYTGFLNGKDDAPGGYNKVFNPTYDSCLEIKDAYYMRAIREIDMEDKNVQDNGDRR